MDSATLDAALAAQRGYFASGATLALEARRAALRRLYGELRRREGDVAAALRADLGKCPEEAYMCETGLLLGGIRYLERHLPALMRARRAPTPLTQFRARSFVSPSPLGAVLIISPWNYPFLLSLGPLAAAVAAGNTAVLKPASSAPASAALIAEIVAGVFAPEQVLAVAGGREENAALLGGRFDRIFFTGGAAAGREVLRRAAEHLTPVTLELGGKSPCIVDGTADIALAARRIACGKLINCGQTCVAPDYVLCDARVETELLSALAAEFRRQCPDALGDESYGHMVNARHFERVRALIDPQKVVYGGGCDPRSLKIEPTLLAGVTAADAVMGEEIFGPVLPVLTYRTLDEAVAFVESRPRPLALYLFTRSRENKKRVLARCRFGGGCINDTVVHLANERLPFGGVGESGMGAYHGRRGFEEFSHLRGVMDRALRPDLPVKYRPFGAHTLALLRRLMY